MTSPFEVLGVDRDADDGEIESAYRRRVKETHPDQGGSVEAFQRVAAAYEELAARGRTDRSPGTRDGIEAGRRGRSAQESPGTATVEYLNYEVLDDHGWSLDDEDLFEKAAAADLAEEDYGELATGAGDALLEAAESCGFTWPYSCRGGACANCAVAVVDGELSTPVDHILTENLLDRGIRLSCLGTPETDALRVVYNVKHMPDLEDLLLPPGPFARAND